MDPPSVSTSHILFLLLLIFHPTVSHSHPLFLVSKIRNPRSSSVEPTVPCRPILHLKVGGFRIIRGAPTARLLGHSWLKRKRRGVLQSLCSKSGELRLLSSLLLHCLSSYHLLVSVYIPLLLPPPIGGT